jgi:hypothetical protein
MNHPSRRDFVGLSIAGLSALSLPQSATAATEAPTRCVTGPLPDFLPSRLTVDSASRQNFQAFRRYSDYLGLAGVVSMTFVRGNVGTYPAGNLFLYPWLKPKGQAVREPWPAAVPTDATQFFSSSPIPGATLPLDEYFCRVVLQAPLTSFIGFQVDQPLSAADGNPTWFTNVDKLADGKSAGIDWTSANLNEPWFGGSRWIPNTDTCRGKAWRQVIIDGVNQASVGV